ncbi:puromycin-sensitive aminopeptidase-like [Bidens hawaiensis]|uniref:puromycin-sensitive aminopeptidase-like n=1 Tax=Bidens hawaiensis TaxID=980011 RepID=UPI0040499778
MENKSMNIFNSDFVLASPETATDANNAKILNVVGHEVYEKGADIVCMYKILLGSQGFRKGMDLYFQRHDGQAVTCEDIFVAMQYANESYFGIQKRVHLS